MQTNINYCIVKECRYKFTHTTRHHKCGICSINGHGQIECHNYRSVENLKNNFNDMLNPEKRCTIEECKSNLFHSNVAHYCYLCNQRGHGITLCPNKLFTVSCPICRAINKVSADQKKIKGLTDICSVCFDKNVEMFFPTCGHVCVCYECFIQTSKNS